MRLVRWTTRIFLLLAVVALAAGCAAPDESGVRDEGISDDVRQPGPTGCIAEGDTGDPDGDIATDETSQACRDDAAVNGTTAG